MGMPFLAPPYPCRITGLANFSLGSVAWNILSPGSARTSTTPGRYRAGEIRLLAQTRHKPIQPSWAFDFVFLYERSIMPMPRPRVRGGDRKYMVAGPLSQQANTQSSEHLDRKVPGQGLGMHKLPQNQRSVPHEVQSRR